MFKRLSLIFVTILIVLSFLTEESFSQPFAYVANWFDDNISVIDLSNNTVINTIPVGDGPFALAINPDGTKVYVADQQGISIIDTATNAVIDNVSIGINGIVFSPDGTMYYVTNGSIANGTVRVLDSSTNTVIDTIPVGTQPSAIVIGNDVDDLCSNSNIDPTVIIDGCDSGVANVVNSDGCTILDLVEICVNEATNHGSFQSCVSSEVNQFKIDGLISGKDKGKITSCSARADLP